MVFLGVLLRFHHGQESRGALAGGGVPKAGARLLRAPVLILISQDDLTAEHDFVSMQLRLSVNVASAVAIASRLPV